MMRGFDFGAIRLPLSRGEPIPRGMNPRLRRLLITLGVLLVVILAVGLWIVRGNPSDRPIAATTGTQPLLVEADTETIPSVRLAETIGWKTGEAPKAPAGLAV